MAGPFSAKTGVVTYDAGGRDVTILDVRSISWDRTSDNKEYASSSTAGIKKRVAGHKDSSGTLEIFAQDGDVDIPFDEGDTLSLKVQCNVKGWSCPIIVDSIGAAHDIEGGELIGVTVAFSGNGAWSMNP